MSMFRAKKLDIGCFVNIKTIRDHSKRKAYAQFEPERQALRYIIRNTTLPSRARAEAQLQLTQMHCYTRPTQIRGRCILGGKGRGILRDFKMSRNAGYSRKYPRREKGQLVNPDTSDGNWDTSMAELHLIRASCFRHDMYINMNYKGPVG
ncbi:hypothetical protein F5Y11DRAFT_122278 [Daldinia sp. FL1419]|nr:hypothetical protein F5Y11DRAFT_122278 [Daldinia sp. FL1419]